jgi:hypothetical protein
MLGAACAKKPQPAQSMAAPPLPIRPLAPFAARVVAVVPAQHVRPVDSLGWVAQAGNPREYLASLDNEITFALSERGLRGTWVFPEQVVRSAKRNAAHAPDPRALATEWLRPPVRRPPELLAEPLGSQLRALVALHDTRFALLPVEIRFEKAGGAGFAVLHVALVDARLSRILWRGDLASDTTSSFSPSLAASVAGHLADLIAAP